MTLLCIYLCFGMNLDSVLYRFRRIYSYSVVMCIYDIYALLLASVGLHVHHWFLSSVSYIQW